MPRHIIDRSRQETDSDLGSLKLKKVMDDFSIPDFDSIVFGTGISKDTEGNINTVICACDKELLDDQGRYSPVAYIIYNKYKNLSTTGIQALRGWTHENYRSRGLYAQLREKAADGNVLFSDDCLTREAFLSWVKNKDPSCTLYNAIEDKFSDIELFKKEDYFARNMESENWLLSIDFRSSK